MGELAVFDIRIANNGERPATNLQVFVEYDPVFALSRASPNHEVIEGRLVWSIPARVVTEPRRAMTEIAPRDSVQFAFECRAVRRPPRRAFGRRCRPASRFWRAGRVPGDSQFRTTGSTPSNLSLTH